MAQKNNIQFSIDFKKGDTKALRELKNDLAEIQQMASQNVQGSTAEELNKITTAAHALESALNQAFDPDLNTVNVQKFNQVLRQSGMNAETLYKDLSMAGIAGQQAFLKMSGQLMQFNTAIKQSNEFLNGLATTFFNTIKWSVMSSIVNNISGTIQKSFYYIKDLNTGLNDIRIVTGKSADEMERFAVTANDAAKALSVSTEDFTKGALIYYQQGLDDETSTQLAEITAKTANVTGQSMSAVSEELTAVWNGYQVANQAAEEGMQVYEEYVDKMAAVGATTASDLEELSIAMSKVASAASAMGVNFDDLNAQIATIVSVTRQAPESVGTALKTIYARLGDLKIDGVDEFGVKLGEVSQQLQDIGINVLDQNGNLRNMSDVIAEVADHWNTWTDAQRQAAAVAMAGKRQYNNLIALFDNQEMHEEALATSMGAVGTLSQQQVIAAESLAKKMEKMSATAEDLYGNLFDEDSLIGLVEAGTNALQLLADFTESVGGLKNLLPMLGSLGLQVFNEQIGKGLANIVINAQTANREIMTMQESQQALQAMFSSSTFVSGAGANTTALKESAQELYSYYQQMAPYQSAMTKEQKEQYNNILNLKVEAGNLSVELEKQAEYQALNTKHMQYVNTAVVENLKDTKAITEETTKLNQIIDLIDKHIYNPQSENVIDDIGIDLINIGQTLKLDDDMILQIIDKIERAAVAEEDVEAGGQKIINELAEVRDALASMQVQQSKVDSLDNSFKKLGNTLLKTSQLTKTISDFTALTGAMGQVASMVNTFQNLEKVWSDENLTDAEKMTQTVMNLSFVMTGFISILGTLKKTAFGDFIVKQLEAVTAARHAHDVTLAASKIIMDANTASIVESITAEEARAIANGETTLAEIIKQKAEAKGIEITTLDTKAIEENTIAKIANTKATDAQAAAESSKNALSGMATSIMSQIGPTGIAGIIIGILALITTAVLKAKNEELDKLEELRKARAEEIASLEEERKERIKDIEANQELAQSYIDLYAQYEKGKIGKEQLENASEDIVKILGKEAVAVATLTDNYEFLNDKLKEVRNQSILNAIEEDKRSMQENVSGIEENVFGKNLYGSGNSVSDSELKRIEELYNGNTYESELIRKYINLNTSYNSDGKGGQVRSGSFTVKEDIEDFDPYELLKAIQATGIQTDLSGVVARYTRNYITASEDLILKELEKDLSDKDLENIDNYSDYNKILQNTIAKIQKDSMYNKDYDAAFDKAMEIISRLSGNNKQYENRAYTEKAVLDKYVKGSNARSIVEDLMDTFSDEDLSLLIQSKIYIDEKTSKEDVLNQLKILKDSFSPEEDLSIALSLRTKLSDTNLTKKELEEYYQELGLLSSQYEKYLFNFENKSALEKLDALNAVVDEQIAKNEEYAKSGIHAQEEFIEEYERAVLEYQKLNAQREESHLELTGQEKEDYEQLNEYLKSNKAAYEEYIETVNNFDYDNSIFNNLIAGIDGVISKADLLKDLAESVGDNFTIAASDVEKFASTFPELLKDITVLEDGSMQLSKEVVDNNIKGLKEEIEARTQAKIAAIDQEIALKELDQEFTQKKLDNIQAYLKGERTAEDLKADLYQTTYDYQQKLRDLTGVDIEKLANFDIESSIKEAKSVTEAIDGIGKAWSEVSKAHAAAIKGEEYNWGGVKFEGTGSTVEEYATSLGGEAKALYDQSKEEYESAFNAALQYSSQLNVIGDELNELYAKRALLESTSNASIDALDRVISGKAGKASKDKGSKDAKSKDEKEYKDEFNRYFDIEKAIEDVDHAVKQLEKDQKNLHGKGLIESLQKENELIEKQTENYEKLYELQKEEAKELIGKLKGLGLTFDDSGAITNYAEATKKALDDYNKAVAQYNADQNDEVFEIHEKAYENFKKTLERYESLYYKEMKDTQDKIDDNNRKVLENNLKGWEVEIELRLNTNKMEQDWNSFLRKINKDYKKVFKDLGQEMQDLIAQTGELEKDQAVYLDELDDVTAEIDKMVAGEGSDMFENIDQAKEKLKELYDQIISNGEDIYDLQQEAWDNYLDSIDQAADKLDLIKDGWEKINDELEFEKQLIELVYGEKAYDLMSTYYTGQKDALEGQLQSTKSIADTWHQLQEESGATMENRLSWNEDQKKYYEEWQETQGELQDQLINYIKLLKEDYLNTVDNILDKLDKKLFGNDGLDEIKKEQENITWYSDRYLDDTEKALEIETLRNKINEEIDKTDDVKIQQKLQKFRDKELKQLAEKKDLTEYDLKAAEARYQIQLKEIALEDSRNNKTSMKLTRNAQGNWSYQYVADEEEVENKQQELLDAQKDYYALTKEQMKKAYSEQIDMYSAYMDAIKEIAADDSIDEETRQKKMTKIKETYMGKLDAISEDYDVSREDSLVAAAATTLSVYEQNNDAYEYFTAEQKALTDTLVASDITDFMDLEYKVGENFNNMAIDSANFLATSRDDQTATATQIIEQQNGDSDESIKNQINIAIEDIMTAGEEYRVKMNEVAESVGYDLGEEGIVGRIKDVETEEDRLGKMTEELTKTTYTEIEKQKSYLTELEGVWRTVEDAVRDAIDAIDEYLRKVAEANVKVNVGIGGTIDASSIIAKPSSISATVTKKGKGGGKTPPPEPEETKEVYTIRDSYTGKIIAYTDANNEDSVKKASTLDSYFDDQYYDSATKEIVNIKDLEKAEQFASGGYTGNQGSDEGRLAVLHEKELVLNEKDTDNILDMINLIKHSGERMINNFEYMESALHNSINAMRDYEARVSYRDYINSIGRMTESSTGDTFYIDKLEFPNANSVDEIREAILTLPNIASQFVGRNTK